MEEKLEGAIDSACDKSDQNDSKIQAIIRDDFKEMKIWEDGVLKEHHVEIKYPVEPSYLEVVERKEEDGMHTRTETAIVNGDKSVMKWENGVLKSRTGTINEVENEEPHLANDSKCAIM